MPFGGLAYEERFQDECHQNNLPKSYSVTSLSSLTRHTVRAVAVWSLKGPQYGKKLAEAEGAEMILTLCHRSSLLHILGVCKVNRCSFKGREIRVRSTKQIWSEQLSLVDLRGLKLKFPLSLLKLLDSRQILRHADTKSEKFVCFPTFQCQC